MIEVPRKYQACFFADLADFKPSVDTINPLLEAFRDRELLPTTFHEFSLSGPAHPGAQPIPGMEPRLRLASSDNEWVVDFDTQRISIEKNPVKATGANLGAPEAFTRDSLDFVKRILHLFPRKGVRLSLVTDGLMGEMAEDRLRSIYAHIMKPLDFYVENAPVGWNSRSVARIHVDMDGSDEEVNVITDVNRVRANFPGEEGPEPFDRIQIGFDINTYQGNRHPRFDVRHAEAFFPKAIEVRDRILSLLQERFNG